jgi:hypothetical protein
VPPLAWSRATPPSERAHEGTYTRVPKRCRDVIDGHLSIREQLLRDLEADSVKNQLEGCALGFQAPVQRPAMHRQHLCHVVA